MNKNVSIGIGMLVVIIVVGYGMMQLSSGGFPPPGSVGGEEEVPQLESQFIEPSQGSLENDTIESIGSSSLGEPPAVPTPDPPIQGSRLKEFTIIAKQFTFEPSTITVDKGDTVRLHIKSTDVEHGIAIFEFGINQVLPPNEEKVVEFVASKSGSFPMFCSVFCGAGHLDMKGTLIVR